MNQQKFEQTFRAKINSILMQFCQINGKIDENLMDQLRSSIFGAIMRVVNSKDMKGKKLFTIFQVIQLLFFLLDQLNMDKGKYVTKMKLLAKEKKLKAEKEAEDMAKLEEDLELLEKTLSQSEAGTFDFDVDESFMREIDEIEKKALAVEVKDEKEEEEKAAKRMKMEN